MDPLSIFQMSEEAILYVQVPFYHTDHHQETSSFELPPFSFRMSFFPFLFSKRISKHTHFFKRNWQTTQLMEQANPVLAPRTQVILADISSVARENLLTNLPQIQQDLETAITSIMERQRRAQHEYMIQFPQENANLN